MQLLDTIGILTTLSVLFAFINYHLPRLQLTISLMLQSLVFSGALILLLAVGIDTAKPVQVLLTLRDPKLEQRQKGNNLLIR